MDFPIADLLDEDACSAKILLWLHPGGLACPRCHGRDRMAVHRRRRAPALDYRCGHCRRVFNAFTGSALQGTKRRLSQLVLIVRGFAQGVPTAQLARAGLRPLGRRITEKSQRTATGLVLQPQVFHLLVFLLPGLIM
jgi:transposase-like protein